MTIKNKVNKMQQELTKSILEQQILKSENAMLKKELQRLKKRQQLNREYLREQNEQKQITEMEQKINQKYRKQMDLLDSKIENCNQTIWKLKKLIQTPVYLGIDKQNQNQNVERPLPQKAKKQKHENIVTSIKCYNCQQIMMPCQFYSHLENDSCIPRNYT